MPLTGGGGLARVPATVEDSTACLGQTLRTGRPLVGELSFHGVPGPCTNSMPLGLPGGIQAQGMRRRAVAGSGFVEGSSVDPT